MRIYIDESGTFQIPQGKDRLFSVVAALVVPAAREADLFYEFLRLRDQWGVRTIEIKGSELDEGRMAQTVELLTMYDVVLEFLAIDMAWHNDSDLTEFRLEQARQIVDSMGPRHQPTMVAQMKDLGQRLTDTPNQLFVQAFLTMRLVWDVIQTTTHHYCQRKPAELGHFDWVIDRKDRELTSMEKLWTELIIPVGTARSLKERLVRRDGGDYSHFERFRIKPGEMAKHAKWMAQNVTFALQPGQRRPINMKRVLQESFRFADSKAELGLQLADIVSNACRRAFNGNLQRSGWEPLGRLLIKNNRGAPFIGMRTPKQTADCDRSVHKEAAGVWQILDSTARSM